MLNEGRIEAVQHNLYSVKIKTIKSKEFDILYQVKAINIFENLFCHYIHGEVLVADPYNYFEKYPFIGDETIEIVWNSLDFPKKTFVGKIYQIAQGARILKDKVQVYTIKFISPEVIDDQSIKISKYFSGKIESIIDDILSNHLLTNKKYYTSETDLSHQLIIPNKCPFDAINNLVVKAVDKNDPTASYVFYECMDGYTFTNIPTLSQRHITRSYLYEPANVQQKDFAATNRLDEEIRDIENFNYDTRFDRIEALKNAMLGSTLLTYDILRKKWQHNSFNYHNHFEQIDHLDPGEMIDIKTQCPENSFFTFKTKHYESYDNYKTNNIENYLQPRLSEIQNIKNVSINIDVPGDSELRPGHVVEFNLRTQDASTQDPQMDKYFSGKYIVGAIKHFIPFDGKYRCQISLFKDSLPNEL